MNQLVILGTAGDVEVMARGERGSGGFLLILEGNQFHLDPGPGSLTAARAAGINPRETIAVIASNDSLLRSNDVNAVVSAMTLDGLDKHGVLIGSKSVVEGGVLRQFYKQCVEGLVALAPGQKVGINEVTFVPVRAAGRDPTGIGFRISTEHVTLGYPGETRWYEGIVDAYAGCDVLLVNVRHPVGTREEGFFNVEDAERFITGVKPRLAILTGFGSKLLQEDLRDLARQLQRRTKVEVTAAKDGQKVKLPRATR